MADPQADPSRPPDPHPPDGTPAPAVEPSDDTPTVITRTPPRPVHPEEAFPGTLRGRRLAHFELLDAIGVGGMAAVIRARDTQLDRPVALKILPPEMAADPENVRRFHQEARAAAKLDHENIARVFFCGEDQGLHFIAFEFVEGENLRTLLDRRGQLPVAEAVNYILQVATGLAHAAARGVVHRDIKPSNIIVSSNGRAKLVDMGLARSLEPQGDNGLTQSGVTLGTFDYISPEQALEPREADVRSDIYSLGCTFYHVLTGRAPVPEGTAAKKLHHHQHVAPLDPRQLNPEIPDELAAVLAHMMAKDPRHRYQRAEHLVQHLLHLAQKLGGVAEASGGVLFVDTPLPSPPHARPFVVGGAALAVLAVLVVSLGMIAPPPPVNPADGLAEGDPVGAPGETPATPGRTASAEATLNKAPQAVKPVVPAAPRKDCRTADELANFLRTVAKAPGNGGTAEALLTGDLTLGQGAGTREGPGLVFAAPGRQLTIRPKLPGQRPTIRFVYNPDLRDDGPAGDPVWTALTVRGGHVRLEDLRFEVSAFQAQILMAAVRAQDNARLTLERCEFILTDPPRTDPNSNWLSALVVANAHADLHACYFGTQEPKGNRAGPAAPDNQSAFTVSGSGVVNADDCAFAVTPVLGRLRQSTGPEPRLILSHCSAFLSDGAAFQVEDGTSCNLVVRNCLFSNPERGMTAGTAALVHQAGAEGTVTFTGSDNRYHNLTAFWTGLGAGDVVRWGDFQRHVAMTGGKDEDAQVLTASPWADQDPLARLREGRPRLAFRLDAQLRELRETNQPDEVVGVRVCSWGEVYAKPLPSLEPRSPGGRTAKVVDPERKEAGGGVYPTLASAIEEAKPGDEIQIRHNGLVPVKPVELPRADDDITLKPAPGFHPVLTLGNTSNLDAALFRLGDGKLRLEGLEFYLRPGREEFTAQSVVDVIGSGECQFKGCVATLEEPHGKPLALVMLTDPSQVMKMDSGASAPAAPRVSLDRCFVRGQGDLLAVRAPRPLSLNLTNSLVALAGSFLNVEGNARDPLKAEPIKVELTQVTAYLSDYLVYLRAGKDGKGPVPVQVTKAANCLFASASEGKALVHLDGLEALDFRMKNQFSWENGRQNTYSKFQPMLDQKPKGDEVPMLPFDQQKWKSFTNEADGVFTPVKFANPPDTDAALSRATPTQFKVKGETAPSTGGADIDQMPRPLSPPGETETTGK